VFSYETTGRGSILGVAIFPGSGVADSKRFKSRGGYGSAVEICEIQLKL